MSIISIVKYVLLLAIGGVLVVMAQQNVHSIELFNFWSEDAVIIPAYILIFVMFLLGLFTGAIVTLLQKFKGFRANRKLKQRIKALENELSSLKIQGDVIDLSRVE